MLRLMMQMQSKKVNLQRNHRKSPKLEDKPETTKIEPQNKLILTLIKKVEINSEKITSLTNTVKSNIKKISKILVRGPNKRSTSKYKRR